MKSILKIAKQGKKQTQVYVQNNTLEAIRLGYNNAYVTYRLDSPMDEAFYSYDKESKSLVKSMNLSDALMWTKPLYSHNKLDVHVSTKKLQFVHNAAFTDKSRFYIYGVAFTPNVMVATNGHMLNISKLEHSELRETMFIDYENIEMMLEMAKEEKVKAFYISWYTDKQIEAVIGRYTVRIHVSDNEFIDSWERTVPSDYQTSIDYDFSVFKGFKPEDYKIILSGDKAYTSNKMENEFHTGLYLPEGQKFAYNFYYLSNSVREGFMYYDNDTTPTKIVSYDGVDTSVIMPMRLDYL